MNYVSPLILIIFGTLFTLSKQAPRYFAIDIDKTFYIEDSAKFAKNVESFHGLTDKHIVGFFCTGRTKSSAMSLVGDDFVTKTGYNGSPGVYSNGAIVYDQNGAIISHCFFKADFLKKIVDYVVQNDLQEVSAFQELDTFYILKDLKDKFKGACSTVNSSFKLITREDLAQKKIIYILTTYELNLPELHGRFVTKRSRKEIYHITPEGITKAHGIKRLLDSLNTSADQCAFIGDGDNDIEAMQFCGNSYAVGDALSHVKQAAKTVLTKNFDEGAFAEAVDSYVRSTAAGGGCARLHPCAA